jgi:uncharacterized protein
MNDNPSPRPAWREPMLWLVVGGPAAVVVAGVVTAVIAVRGADPVLDTRSTPGAVQARNHAATGLPAQLPPAGEVSSSPR